ncbi:proproteinase E-like [Micropterus salmoides]|uniref:proproteinase E-like n=1 Tax=Micropterus salmoides TaxID=27706 RepID=UPI0018EB15AF|nr:proproteinase E-like [Micropterus salmoides]
MRYSIKKCKHPSCTKLASGNDIMLFKLSKKAQLGKIAQLTQLPNTDNKIKHKEKCQVAGRGSTKTGGKAVDVLQVVNVPFVNLEVCKKEWADIGLNLPANVICAGGYDTKNGFCQGDLGGPLVCSAQCLYRCVKIPSLDQQDSEAKGLLKHQDWLSADAERRCGPKCRHRQQDAVICDLIKNNWNTLIWSTAGKSPNKGKSNRAEIIQFTETGHRY